MDANPGSEPKDNDNAQPGQSQAGRVGDVSGSGPINKAADPNKPIIHWPYVWGTIVGAFALLGGLSGFYVVAHWMEGRIDQTVERKLSDETILRKIAAQSRPALIFDSNESIRSTGLGAENLIADNGKGIHVAKQKDGWPTDITIEFTKPVPDAPILSCLDETVVIFPKPGKGYLWHFEIHDIVQHGWYVSNVWSFRLELAP